MILLHRRYSIFQLFR